MKTPAFSLQTYRMTVTISFKTSVWNRVLSYLYKNKHRNKIMIIKKITHEQEVNKKIIEKNQLAHILTSN
ncbi:hypothetical protein DQM68_06445 [Leptospira mayottensis]|uniref:Uncharacterized protein n=2 Tax=Leptospira mayottensis TaxID=1137606 RepID=A0AA87MR23_9LEPT|nr:hypothetical protein DQM68_06445 [Leptospira mayottensis]AXR64201.1 hypothetical protein DQM28_08155 [Leptospira mayottensis]AZQ03184.1 hypothetical protein LEP1GSC190_15245 [Leptospira mayottensis 200901116]EKS02155.1 hypothetical protein LEP1GSC125_0725 [Leptospira mayottensis 200901122]TGN06643.1 hypothetical protein EHR03_10190 [Leptospira mayottensis]